MLCRVRPRVPPPVKVAARYVCPVIYAPPFSSSHRDLLTMNVDHTDREGGLHYGPLRETERAIAKAMRRA